MWWVSLLTIRAWSSLESGMKKGISKKKKNRQNSYCCCSEFKITKNSLGELKGDASLSLSPLPPHNTGWVIHIYTHTKVKPRSKLTWQVNALRGDDQCYQLPQSGVFIFSVAEWWIQKRMIKKLLAKVQKVLGPWGKERSAWATSPLQTHFNQLFLAAHNGPHPSI